MSVTPISKLFFGGVPTDADVRKLMDTFKDRSPGDSILYAEIAEAIQKREGTSRFKTVRDAWRKRLRKEKNIVTVCIAGSRTVRLLKDDERAGDAFGDLRRSIKGIGRAHKKAVDIPTERLSPPQRDTAMHTRRISEAISAAARTASNDLAVVFAPPKQLPRVIPNG